MLGRHHSRETRWPYCSAHSFEGNSRRRWHLHMFERTSRHQCRTGSLDHYLPEQRHYRKDWVPARYYFRSMAFGLDRSHCWARMLLESSHPHCSSGPLPVRVRAGQQSRQRPTALTRSQPRDCGCGSGALRIQPVFESSEIRCAIRYLLRLQFVIQIHCLELAAFCELYDSFPARQARRASLGAMYKSDQRFLSNFSHNGHNRKAPKCCGSL